MIPNQPGPDHDPHVDEQGRQRLHRLIELRDTLGTLGAERRSHRLPDSWVVAHELHMVEEEIRDCWPQLHADRFADWVRHDEERVHAPHTLHADCGICEAIAAETHVNLRAPEAA